MNQRFAPYPRAQAPTPSIKTTKECHFYQIGECKFGMNCKFSHSGRPRGSCNGHCVRCEETKRNQLAKDRMLQLRNPTNPSFYTQRLQTQTRPNPMTQTRPNPMTHTRQMVPQRPNFQIRSVPQHTSDTDRKEDNLNQRLVNDGLVPTCIHPYISNSRRFFNRDHDRTDYSPMFRVRFPSVSSNCSEEEDEYVFISTLFQENEHENVVEEKFEEKTVEEEKWEEETDSDKACTVCLTYKRDHAFVPCGHVALCGKCAKNTEKLEGRCVLCRKDFKFVIKIYN